jgi:hypothetical protein
LLLITYRAKGKKGKKETAKASKKEEGRIRRRK